MVGANVGLLLGDLVGTVVVVGLMVAVGRGSIHFPSFFQALGQISPPLTLGAYPVRKEQGGLGDESSTAHHASVLLPPRGRTGIRTPEAVGPTPAFETLQAYANNVSLDVVSNARIILLDCGFRAYVFPLDTGCCRSVGGRAAHGAAWARDVLHPASQVGAHAGVCDGR